MASHHAKTKTRASSIQCQNNALIAFTSRHGGVELGLSYESFQGCARLFCVHRPDRILTDTCWNDKSFGIMNGKWFKRVFRAFNDYFFAFHQVQHVNAAIGVMWHAFGEPVAASFNEFTLMQAGFFFRSEEHTSELQS